MEARNATGQARARRALIFWSSGKDSAYALYTLRQQGDVEVVGLLTTVNRPPNRVAVHAVPESLLAVQADGAQITTVEGLAKKGDAGEELHPLQRAFAETWAFQCGFCTQGMLISCFALLETNLDPTREEILTAISGNFCRCTAYQNVIKSVQLAAAELRASANGVQDGHD